MVDGIDDPLNLKTFEETAKAVGKVADASGKAIDGSRELGGFVGRVLGGVPENAVGILGGDWLAIKRQERILVMAQKTTRKLRERGIEQTETVPMSVGVPLLQAASLEEDEGLSDKWASLLANYMDPGSGIKPRKAFTRILEGIDPIDAKVLDFLGNQGWELFNVQRTAQGNSLKAGVGPQGFNAERIATELDTDIDEIRLALGNLAREGMVLSETQKTMDELDLFTSGIEPHNTKAIFRPTDLGWALISACGDKTSGEAT